MMFFGFLRAKKEGKAEPGSGSDATDWTTFFHRPLGSTPLSVSASDPLNFQGILTPDERVPASAGYAVAVG